MSNKLSIFAELKTAGFNKGLKEMQSGLKGIGEQSKKVGRSLTTFVTGGIVALGAGALKAASDMQYMETQLATLTGSAAKGKAMMKELADFTAKTPFQIEGVQSAAKQLLASGTAAEDVSGQLQFLGDIAAAVGKPIEDMVRPFAKVQAQGRVTGETLQMFMDRGINIMPELAKVTGISMEDLRKAISKGEVSAKDLEKALDRMNDAGGLAEGGMENLSKTLKGQVSTALDNIKLAAAEFGKVIMPIAVQVTQKVTEMAQRFASLDDGTKKLIVGVLAAAAAVGPLLMIFGQMASSLSAISTLFSGMGMVAGGGMAATLSTVLPVVAAVAALAIGIMAIIDNWEAIKAYFTEGDGASFFTNLVERFNSFKEAAWNTIKGLVNDLIYIFDWVLGGIMTLWDNYGTDILAFINKWVDYILDTVEIGLNMVKGVFDAIVSLISGDWQGFFQHLVNVVIDGARLIIRGVAWMAMQTATLLDGLISMFGGESNLAAGIESFFAGIDQELEGMKLEVETPEPSEYEARGRKAREGFMKGFKSRFAGFFGGSGSGSTEMEEPTDSSSTSTVQTGGASPEGWAKRWEEASASIETSVNQGLGTIAGGMVEMLGQVMSGTATMADVGNMALTGLADMLISVGKLAIQTGIAVAGIKEALKSLNPAVAIAAGIALVALGSAVKGSLGRNADQMARGAGDGYQIPAFAEGGAVLGPTLALVGEKPGSKGEAIIPFEKMGQFADMMGMNGGATHVVVTGNLKGRDIQLSGQRGKHQRKRRF